LGQPELSLVAFRPLSATEGVGNPDGEIRARFHCLREVKTARGALASASAPSRSVECGRAEVEPLPVLSLDTMTGAPYVQVRLTWAQPDRPADPLADAEKSTTPDRGRHRTHRYCHDPRGRAV
jgi:hypothetical protein